MEAPLQTEDDLMDIDEFTASMICDYFYEEEDVGLILLIWECLSCSLPRLPLLLSVICACLSVDGTKQSLAFRVLCLHESL